MGREGNLWKRGKIRPHQICQRVSCLNELTHKSSVLYLHYGTLSGTTQKIRSWFSPTANKASTTEEPWSQLQRGRRGDVLPPSFLYDQHRVVFVVISESEKLCSRDSFKDNHSQRRALCVRLIWRWGCTVKTKWEAANKARGLPVSQEVCWLDCRGLHRPAYNAGDRFTAGWRKKALLHTYSTHAHKLGAPPQWAFQVTPPTRVHSRSRFRECSGRMLLFNTFHFTARWELLDPSNSINPGQEVLRDSSGQLQINSLLLITRLWNLSVD